MEVYYDLSRLVERAIAPFPSGVDRVDLHYALWTREQASSWVGLLQRPEGLSSVDTSYADNLLTSLRDRWIEGLVSDTVEGNICQPPNFWPLEAKLAILEKVSFVSLRERLEWRKLLDWPFYLQPELCRRLLNLRRDKTHVKNVGSLGGKYWNVGHCFRFTKAAEAITATFGASSVIFLHDVIPMLYPETQRAVSREHFRRFCEWVDQLNAQLIVSSKSSILDMQQMRMCGLDLFSTQLDSLIQLPLPVEASFCVKSTSGVGGGTMGQEPYFLMLGAWEPRKNFELLLEVWERLVSEGGQRIILKWVGARGEISGRSARRLERLKATGWVEELGVIADQTIKEVFSGARALLFPSLIEGWGLPLAEAVASGLPVIASDRPVCREVSQGLVEYLDASQVGAWLECICDFAKNNSEIRTNQQQRIRNFRALSWSQYFDRLSCEARNLKV